MKLFFFHEFKHKTLINLRFLQIISDRYNRKGVLNSLYYDLNKYNNINITSNPNRERYIHKYSRSYKINIEIFG